MKKAKNKNKRDHSVQGIEQVYNPDTKEVYYISIHDPNGEVYFILHKFNQNRMDTGLEEKGLKIFSKIIANREIEKNKKEDKIE